MDSDDIPEWQGLPEVGTGQLAAIGRLYNARDERILYSSIIKGSAPPSNSIMTTDAGGLRYRYTTTDSLGERLSNLNISAEMGIKVLCGTTSAGWCAEYLSRETANKHVQQASTICITPTKTETLNLESDDLKSHLNLEALNTDEATHVIWGIEWGARTMVTVREATADRANNWDAWGKFSNQPSNSGEFEGLCNENAVSRFAKYIGEVHIEAKATKDKKNTSASTNFLFDIVADVANLEHNRVGADFDSVNAFLQGIPGALEKVNGGKGVPIAMSLMPLSEVAKVLKVPIQYNRVTTRIQKSALKSAVKALEKYERRTQEVDDYATLVQDHRHCVPGHHVRAANAELGKAQNDETKFRIKLARTINAIHGGSANINDLWELLRNANATGSIDSDCDSGDVTGFRIGDFAHKMAFADLVKSAGAQYFGYEQRDSCIIDDNTRDLYLLHLSQKAQREQSWSENFKTIRDLLNAQDAQYRVAVVDYDVKTPKGVSLDNAYIEQYRNGKVIVTDVTESRKELDRMCQLKCGDVSAVDRTRSYDEPPGSRVVRIPCPGEDCWETGVCEWTCPNCRDLVHYGVTDHYLYCRCCRFPFQNASFKCNGDRHGATFAKYGNEDLHKRLKGLDVPEEYTFLLLGNSGAGKSMFINAIFNYFEYETMQDAMADDGPIQYVIPFSFQYEDEEGCKHTVKEGQPTLWERISSIGKSSTRKTVTYCFSFGGKLIRFIDTPGINDTDGIGQDHSNIEDIFQMLEAIPRLNAVMILLSPTESRLGTAFKYCISELLSRLHRDTRKNIIFTFTKAKSANFTAGGTSGLLDIMLEELNTGIVRERANQFFFDSEGFMFLAGIKQKLPERPGGVDHYAKLWSKSRGELHRLLDTVASLPSHDVSMTLKLQRTGTFLEGIAKVLSEFTTVSKKTEKQLQDGERELERVIERGENLAEKAKTNIFVTVRARRALPEKERRTVCCHEKCTDIFHDEEGNAQINYRTVCHENCDLTDVGDGFPGTYPLRYCSPFRWLWIFPGYPCNRSGCEHDWELHQHISYEWYDVVREVKDERVKEEIKSNEEARDELHRKIGIMRKYQEHSRKERAQIQAARAMFFVYLSQNSVGSTRKYDDATVRYLDYSIAVARREGKWDVAAELSAQKEEHESEKRALMAAIDAGTATKPDDADVDRKIESLLSMVFLGPELSKMMGTRNLDVDESRFIYVRRREKAKKGRGWSLGL